VPPNKTDPNVKPKAGMVKASGKRIKDKTIACSAKERSYDLEGVPEKRERKAKVLDNTPRRRANQGSA